MSTHVLLNLLNELDKRDKMRDLPSILSLFRNFFYKFNNTYMSMNVRFYLSYEIMITLKSHFCRENIKMLSLCLQGSYGRHNVSRTSIKPLVVYQFYCMVLYHPQTPLLYFVCLL